MDSPEGPGWLVSLSRGMLTPASPLRLLGLEIAPDRQFATARIRAGRNARRVTSGSRVRLVTPDGRLCGIVERTSSENGHYVMVVRIST
jgi:hypothetical protein